MGIIEDAVAQLEKTIEGTGCEDGAVTLRRNPDEVTCQYEHGVCIEALYGGRSGEFVTTDPVEATTKISFLFGASLSNNTAKSAACAVINVIAAFLCISRKVRACPPSAHPPCLLRLKEHIGGRQVFLVGDCPILRRELGAQVTDDPASAGVLIINNEGLLQDGTEEIFAATGRDREILCIGPSLSGVADLNCLERFCPYGT